jgi:hypothetical protein
VFFWLGERGVAVSIIRVDVGVSGRRAAWWQQTLCGVVERSYYNFSSLASRVYYRFSEGFHLSSFLLCVCVFFFVSGSHFGSSVVLREEEEEEESENIYWCYEREL